VFGTSETREIAAREARERWRRTSRDICNRSEMAKREQNLVAPTSFSVLSKLRRKGAEKPRYFHLCPWSWSETTFNGDVSSYGERTAQAVDVIIVDWFPSFKEFNLLQP